MARDLVFEFYSQADPAHLARAWRSAIEGKRGGGLKKALRGNVTFGTPTPGDDPFARLEQPPLFEAFADIPLGRASSATSCAVHLYLYPNGNGVRGIVAGLSGGMLTQGHRTYFDAAVDGIRQADPSLQVA
jgi:hypothetical protein